MFAHPQRERHTKFEQCLSCFVFIAVDNFVRIQNQPFETFDRKTDQNPTVNCALFTQSGWWFNPQCETVGDLNSPYAPSTTQPQIQGIRWQSDNGIVRLLQTSMRIRPANFPATGKKKKK